MDQIRIVRYNFSKDINPITLANTIVEQYNNAHRQGVIFDSIEIKITDTDREYLLLGKIYALDKAVYRLIEVVH